MIEVNAELSHRAIVQIIYYIGKAFLIDG